MYEIQTAHKITGQKIEVWWDDLGAHQTHGWAITYLDSKHKDDHEGVSLNDLLGKIIEPLHQGIIEFHLEKIDEMIDRSLLKDGQEKQQIVDNAKRLNDELKEALAEPSSIMQTVF